MTRSTCQGETPARSRACREAVTASVVVLSPSDTMRRSRIPVRLVIHSSEVSTSFSRSALVSLFSGTALPQPVIAAYFITMHPPVECGMRNAECGMPNQAREPKACALSTRRGQVAGLFRIPHSEFRIRFSFAAELSSLLRGPGGHDKCRKWGRRGGASGGCGIEGTRQAAPV